MHPHFKCCEQKLKQKFEKGVGNVLTPFFLKLEGKIVKMDNKKFQAIITGVYKSIFENDSTITPSFLKEELFAEDANVTVLGIFIPLFLLIL